MTRRLAFGYNPTALPKVIKGGPAPAQTSSRPMAPQASMMKGAVSAGRPSQKPQILQREIVGAKEEAKGMIHSAQSDAARILDEAQSQAEELRQRGFDEGYQEGLGVYTEKITAALLEVEKMKASLEPEYVGLVRICVEKVLGQELKLHPDAVIGIVRNTLKDATQQREIIVRIHPDDAEVLRKNQRRLLDVLARATAIEVRDDPAGARGGCVVVTELGTIDASLDRQLKAIEAVLQDELDASLAGVDPSEQAPMEEEEEES